MRLNRRKFLEYSEEHPPFEIFYKNEIEAKSIRQYSNWVRTMESYPDRRWQEVYREPCKYERPIR
jgi:hypothetical protein